MTWVGRGGLTVTLSLEGWSMGFTPQGNVRPGQYGYVTGTSDAGSHLGGQSMELLFSFSKMLKMKKNPRLCMISVLVHFSRSPAWTSQKLNWLTDCGLLAAVRSAQFHCTHAAHMCFLSLVAQGVAWCTVRVTIQYTILQWTYCTSIVCSVLVHTV